MIKPTRTELIELIRRIQSGENSLKALEVLQRHLGKPSVSLFFATAKFGDMSPDKILDLLGDDKACAQAPPNADVIKSEAKLSRTLPDSGICRARHSGFGDYANCQVDQPYDCVHALSFGYYDFFCLHPERDKIIGRSGDKPGV